MDRDAAITQLLEQHAGLMRSVIRRHACPRSEDEREQFISVCEEALVLAFDTFDPGRGAEFATHLTWQFRAAIQREKRRTRKIIRTVPLEAVENVPRRVTAIHRRSEPRLNGVLAQVSGFEGKLLRRMADDGLSIEDAGAVLGLEPQVARAAYARAIRRARIIANEQLTSE